MRKFKGLFWFTVAISSGVGLAILLLFAFSFLIEKTSPGISNIAEITPKIIDLRVQGQNIRTFVSNNFNNLISANLGLGGPDDSQLYDPDAQIEVSKKGDENTSGKKYIYRGIDKFPYVTAQGFLVADLETGEIIASKEKTEAFPIASLSKLMTSVVARETLYGDYETIVSRQAVSTYGAQGRLKAGDKISIDELFYPLLLESSNDAAEVLAESNGRSVFLANMNGKAKSLGFKSMTYDDPSGLSPFNISNVLDLFNLTKYIFDSHPDILEITRLKQYEYEDLSRLRNVTWYSNSRFRNDSNYEGGKNGYTDEAKHTLIANFALNLDKDSNADPRIISIVILQSDRADIDARKILTFLKDNIYYSD